MSKSVLPKRDIRELAEDAVVRRALNPPVIFDVEEAWAAAIALFNGGAKALEEGYRFRFGPFSRCGLRLARTAENIRRVRKGKVEWVSEPRIQVRQQFPGAWSRTITLLEIAIMENRTLEIVGPDKDRRHLSKSELSEIAAARAYLAKS